MRIIEEINTDILLLEFENLFNDTQFKNQMNKKNQVSIQKRQDASVEVELSESCGELTKEKGLRDTDFNISINLIKNTYIESIIKKFKLVRTRINRLKPGTCYIWHKDPSTRIHVPLEINEGSFMVVADDKIDMKLGYVYEIDTTKMHTAINSGTTDRYHIVGCVY